MTIPNRVEVYIGELVREISFLHYFFQCIQVITTGGFVRDEEKSERS